MHSLSAIIIALIAGGAAAFTLPAGLGDGVYSVHYDKKGREVHERVPAGGSTLITPREGADAKVLPLDGLDKRQGPTSNDNPYFIYCGCGRSLDHGDCDAAVDDLKNQLGGDGGCAVVPKDLAFYSIRGSVVAFVCNVGNAGDVGVCANNFGYSLQVITQDCGWYVAGTYRWVLWEPEWEVGFLPQPAANMGYMQYYGGEDFCGDATASQVSSC